MYGGVFDVISTFNSTTWPSGKKHYITLRYIYPQLMLRKVGLLHLTKEREPKSGANERLIERSNIRVTVSVEVLLLTRFHVS